MCVVVTINYGKRNFNKLEQQCFIGIQNHEAQPIGFKTDKTRAANFLNGFKNIPGKVCVKRVQNKDVF